jgi:prepilin-type N-terminal cleavage/methylation domain-containing protein
MRVKLRLRGFSLIEVMVVVAMLGVLAAIAGPQLVPEVHKAQLDAAVDASAAFIARARNEAMEKKRCVRVYIQPSTSPRTLIAERLNRFDCDVDPVGAPAIEGGAAGTWIEIGRMAIESPAVTVSWGTAVPIATASAAVVGGTSPGDTTGVAQSNNFLRFRPNGRVFGNNRNTIDDDAELVFTHARLPSASNRHQKRLLVEGNGPICTTPRRGQTFAGTANTAPNGLSCP